MSDGGILEGGGGTGRAGVILAKVKNLIIDRKAYIEQHEAAAAQADHWVMGEGHRAKVEVVSA